VAKQTDQPLHAEQRLAACESEDQRLSDLDRVLAGGGEVRIEDGDLVLRPLSARGSPRGRPDPLPPAR